MRVRALMAVILATGVLASGSATAKDCELSGRVRKYVDGKPVPLPQGSRLDCVASGKTIDAGLKDDGTYSCKVSADRNTGHQEDPPEDVLPGVPCHGHADTSNPALDRTTVSFNLDGQPIDERFSCDCVDDTHWYQFGKPATSGCNQTFGAPVEGEPDDPDARANCTLWGYITDAGAVPETFDTANCYQAGDHIVGIADSDGFYSCTVQTGSITLKLMNGSTTEGSKSCTCSGSSTQCNLSSAARKKSKEDVGKIATECDLEYPKSEVTR